MCDYSAEGVASRSAVVGDTLVSGKISSHTTGFVGMNDKVAVCLLPGTELAFTGPVRYQTIEGHSWLGKPKAHVAGSTHAVARFVQVDMNNPNTFHDAIEFPDGEVVLLQNLVLGQQARVLQLPAPKAHGDSGTDDTVVQPTEFEGRVVGDSLLGFRDEMHLAISTRETVRG
jgi:hypothetical protein